MNINLIYFLILFYLCCACSSGYESPEYVKIADKITDTVIQKIEMQTKLRLIGTGGGMMNCVRMIALGFRIYEEIDLKTARALIVYVINEYLSEINKDENIRPHLCQHPFTANNIEIRIWVYKLDGTISAAENINYVSNINGMINYYFNIKEELLEEMIHEETRAFSLKRFDILCGII